MVDPAVSIFTHRGGAVSKVDVGFKLWPVDWVTAHITTAGWLEGGKEGGGGGGGGGGGEGTCSEYDNTTYSECDNTTPSVFENLISLGE